MKWGIFAFVASIFVGGIIISSTMSGSINGTSVTDYFQSLMSFDFFSPLYWSHWGTALSWNFDIFKEVGTATANGWSIVKYVVFYPISIAVAAGVAIVIVPMILSGIGSLFRMF